jgi:hypothetical protein
MGPSDFTQSSRKRGRISSSSHDFGELSLSELVGDNNQMNRRAQLVKSEITSRECRQTRRRSSRRIRKRTGKLRKGNGHDAKWHWLLQWFIGPG